jgi:molecular chaperone DnaK
VKGNDKEKIEAATQKLTEASQSLAQKLYAEQTAGADNAQAGGKAESKAEEGVVDAEFEEVKDDRK